MARQLSVFVKYNMKRCILVTTEEYDQNYRIKSNAPDIATSYWI